MSERSVQCPVCPFSFAKLADAGDFHAYVCPDCGWTKPTAHRRPGNRPADVCALCDTPIDLRSPGADHHLYVGPDWVHGGGREHIPVHSTCLQFHHLSPGTPLHQGTTDRIRERLGSAR